MEINPIKTEKDYDLALARVNDIFDAKPITKEADELDILVTIIEKYEANRFMTEQNNMTDNDLAVLFKSRSRVSEIFKRKRALSIGQIRLLHDKLPIPANVLIKEYALVV